MWVVWNLNIHAKQLGLLPKCNQKKSQTCHAGIKSFQIFIYFTKRNCQSNTMKFAKMSDFIFQQRRNFFQCQSKAILQSGSKYDRSEVQSKLISHYDIQVIFWIRYLCMESTLSRCTLRIDDLFCILKFIMLTTE